MSLVSIDLSLYLGSLRGSQVVLKAHTPSSLTYLQFPEAHHRKIHSTNLIERLNREIKRRSRVVSIFPNDQAVLRLITMILIEQDDEWCSGHLYLPEISQLNSSSEA